MRWILFIIFVGFSLYANAQTQPDTIAYCDRVPGYMYGPKWVDQYMDSCGGTYDFQAVRWCHYRQHSNIVARFMVVDTPIYVTGVAAPVLIDTAVVFDTAMANREPEYFYLYDKTDSGMVQLAQARWDTTEPVHFMQFRGRRGIFEITHPIPSFQGAIFDTIFLPVYEAHFDKPVLVTDTFYVGGSMFNNICHYMPGHDTIPGYIFPPHWFDTEHPTTQYIR